MKKIFIALIVVAAVIFTLNEEPKKTTYSEEEMREPIYEAERRAYEEGYAEGEYYARGEIASVTHAADGEIERILNEYGDRAYEAGYEDGYYDCLVDHGLD